ncbi:MAG: hypothetical protein H6710_01685 [Myxococcales bacterium]|nr:hypothetical protein [Myxococcales bacterium]
MDRRRIERHRAPLRAIFVVLVALVVIILAPARPAAAASLPHYDLRSLALQSDAIVRVRIVDEPDDPSAPITHQIVTSYLGELEVGAELRLPHAGYSSRTGSFGEGKRAFDDDAVLFLQRAAEGDPSGWRLTESGLRRCAEGLVYRYQQANNPGPYVSVPQGHDPFDVYGDPRGDPGLSMEEFEVEVLAAIAGAVAIRADLERIDDPAARARLLDRIGPAFGDDRDEPTMLVMLAIDDQASLTIIEGLWRAGHREDALAGVDRLRFPLGYHGLALDADPSWLLDVAGDPQEPMPLRRGALLLLEHDLDALAPPAALERLLALLADPDPEIRALAAGIDAAEDTKDPRWRAALIARIRGDEAPRARLALLSALRDATRLDPEYDILGALDLPASTWPIVAARRRGRSFVVEWATPQATWEYEGIELHARLADGKKRTWTRSEHVFPIAFIIGDLALGSDRSWLLFAPKPPEGATRFELRARFVDGDQVKILEPELRGLPALARAATSRVDGDIEAQAAPAPTASPAGCACRHADERGGSTASGALLLVLLLGRQRRASVDAPPARARDRRPAIRPPHDG